MRGVPTPELVTFPGDRRIWRVTTGPASSLSA